MTTDLIAEEIIGIGSLIVSGVGFLIAQTTPIIPATGINVTEFIFQFGGLGLAVWLVIHHTTITIPNLDKRNREEREAILEQHKLEREAALKTFKEELDLNRQEYMTVIKELTKEYSDELAHRRGEILEALKRSECRWNRNGT